LKKLSLISLFILAWSAFTGMTSWAQSTVRRIDAFDLFEAAHAVPMGGDLVVEEVPLDPMLPTQSLVLERFAIFSPDAKIIEHGENGDIDIPIPDNAYFQGTVLGNPHAKAFLSIREDGQIVGLIADRGRFWLAAGGEGTGGPLFGMAVNRMDEFDLSQGVKPLQCSSDLLNGERLPIQAPQKPSSPSPKPLRGVYSAATYNARIAIESDFEYYQRFGNSTDATNYAADLMAFASIVYTDEIDTSLSISHLSLWSSAGDPWSQSSTTCGLFEFGRYWNNNHSGVQRTIAHFLSGKNNNGGIAWVGVLCNNAFNYNHGGVCPSLTPQTSNYGGAYGYSGDLDGNFDINNPGVVWDVVVTAHEMGHNFNSPHSHCYQNIGGNAAAVDNCYSGQCGQAGCYCGGTSLPCGAGPGNGCGTIMSYCHLISGNLTNISFTLGTDHPYGVAPERIPQRMAAAVVNANNSQPDCLPENATIQTFYPEWPLTLSVLDLVGIISP